MHFRLSSLLLTLSILAFSIALLPSVYASSQETLRPNAVGDSTTLTPFPATTPNWNCVNDSTSDGDTSYVRSSTSDSNAYYDLYNIGASSVPSGATINFVNITGFFRSTSNTYKANFRMVWKKSGGSVQYSSDVYIPTTTYTQYVYAFSGLVQSDLDTLQIGVEIISGDKDPLFYAGRCSQLQIVIDYTVVSAVWNTVSTWSIFLVTRSWQSSGTWSEFLISRVWQTSASWSNFLISRTWQNATTWSIIFLTLGWHTVTAWSILLLGEDPTTIIVILFLFSVVACIGLGLYRKKKKS